MLRQFTEPEAEELNFDTLETSGVHEFWLFKEGERQYKEYMGLNYKEAPLLLSDKAARFMSATLAWVPSINPSNPDEWWGKGLNHFGPTVFNHASGEALHKICSGWTQLLSQGPEVLILPTGWHSAGGTPEYFKTHRDPLVSRLQMLADWAAQTMDGTYFILHRGV